MVRERYGAPEEVLSIQERERPTPGKGEVLLRVRGASVNPYDWHFLRGQPYFMRLQSGLRRPKHQVLGADMAGVVEAVGEGVRSLGPGDHVYGEVETGGGFAEYAVAPELMLAPKPENLEFPEAASVPLAGVTALQALRDHGRLERGQHLLVIGASGGVGSFAVQIAKQMEAHVTGVCSTSNLALVRSLGADEVIDYTSEDFADAGPRFDLILQLGGTAPASECRRALLPEGTLLLSSGESSGRWIGPISRMLAAVALNPFVGQTLKALIAKPNRDDLARLRELIEDGAVRPAVERTCELAEVPEAIAQLETGHTRGKVVVAI